MSENVVSLEDHRLQRAFETLRPEALSVDSEEAELCLLAHVMVTEGAALGTIRGWLRPEHFRYQQCAEAYANALALADAGDKVTPVTLRGKGCDAKWLVGLLKDAHLLHTAPVEYGRIIVDAWQCRHLMKVAEGIRVGVAHRFTERLSPPEIATLARQRLDEMGQGPVTAASGGDAADSAMAELDAAMRGDRPAISTGLADLDHALGGGLWPSTMYVLAGRPSMGKTTLGTAIAANVARAGIPVAFISLEEREEDIARRMIASRSNVPFFALRSGSVYPDQVESVTEAAGEIKAWPLWIDGVPGQTPDEIEGRCRELLKGRRGLIVVDHLGKLKPNQARKSLYESISENARDMKSVAKRLGCPLLQLVQLSRANEQRDDKRPQLSDMRDSGAIEEEADAVLFPYREAYYLERSDPARKPGDTDTQYAAKMDGHAQRLAETKNAMDVFIAKSRHGPTKAVKLWCDVATNRITDMVR